jgi:isoleucyl-tRNA synthetase
MGTAMAVVSLGHAARADSRIRVRQPLAMAVVACPPEAAAAVDGLADLVADELNVKAIRLITDPGDLVEVTVKPNYRTLGPRFGPRMPEVAAAVAALRGAETVRTLDAGEPVSLMVNGSVEALGPDDLLREARPSAGYAVAQEGALAVGLATELTPALRREGLAREVIHAVQNARRAAGLRVEERIRLHLDGSGPLREAVEEHRTHIAAETLASELTVGHGAPFAGLRREEHVVDGEPLALRLEPVGEGAPA